MSRSPLTLVLVPLTFLSSSPLTLLAVPAHAVFSSMSLLSLTPHGLYCEAEDFFVDPWEPADRAVITHAHSDHAAWASRAYLTSAQGVGVLRARLEHGSSIRGIEYGQAVSLSGTT